VTRPRPRTLRRCSLVGVGGPAAQGLCGRRQTYRRGRRPGRRQAQTRQDWPARGVHCAEVMSGWPVQPGPSSVQGAKAAVFLALLLPLPLPLPLRLGQCNSQGQSQTLHQVLPGPSPDRLYRKRRVVHPPGRRALRLSASCTRRGHGHALPARPVGFYHSGQRGGACHVDGGRHSSRTSSM
jgi:hypothetical protein